MKLSPEIIDLGRALVVQLDLDDRGDLLARWMAHDIAAKIVAAEAPQATEADKSACAEAILRLWDHRASLPMGKRPFGELGPIIETLRSLDPKTPHNFYVRMRSDAPGESKSWLRMATSIDDAARSLINFCLRNAAIEVGRKPEEWAELAEAAGLEGPDTVIVEVLTQSLLREREARDPIREGLQTQLSTLQRFARLARTVSKQLEAELASLDEHADAASPQILPKGN